MERDVVFLVLERKKQNMNLFEKSGLLATGVGGTTLSSGFISLAILYAHNSMNESLVNPTPIGQLYLGLAYGGSAILLVGLLSVTIGLVIEAKAKQKGSHD